MRMDKSSTVFFIAVIQLLFSGALAQQTTEHTSNEYIGSWAQVPDILARIRVPQFPEQDFNILDFGAEPGGNADSREAILEAIKACNNKGGGRVIVPQGTFLSNGPIHLKSNVNLHLAEGSTILFGIRTADYLPQVLSLYEGTRIYNYSPLIFAYQQKNLAITGKGTVNGQASEVWASWAQDPVKIEKDKQVRRQNNAGVPVSERVYGEGDKIRPGFIQFLECENILFEDFLIIDSPFWCVHPVYCKNVTIRRIRLNTHNINNDGIDPEGCEDVYIHDVEFNTGDDCIAIKAGIDRDGRESGRPSKNIVIRNCIFNAYTAIAIGSDMAGSVYNVFAENCKAVGDIKRGLNIKSNRDRGGEVAHIRIRNMTFLDAWTEMLAIQTDYGRRDNERPPNHYPPHFHDVRWENITATGPCDIGIKLRGQPDLFVENIVFKDIEINGAKIPIDMQYADRLYMQNVTLNGERIIPDALNLPPDVYAGPDQIVGLYETIQLTGQAVDDAGPVNELLFNWTVRSGDAQAVQFENAGAHKTEVAFGKPGRFVLKLTASDGELAGYHYVTILVKASN